MRTRSLSTSVLAALLLSVATIAAAQEASPAPPSPSPSPSPSPAARRGVRTGDVQKVFILKHLGLNDTVRLLSVFPAEIGGMNDGHLRALSVSAAPAVVAAIEETLKRLDVAPTPLKSVEVTVYVLECAATGDPGNVSPDLQDVVVQLKRTFHYSGCTLARTLFARTADGGRVESQFHERGAGTYILAAGVEVDSSEPPVVRLRNLALANVGSESPGGHLGGDIEARDGQKVVLGRLGTVESGKDQIVVLTARIVP